MLALGLCGPAPVSLDAALTTRLCLRLVGVRVAPIHVSTVLVMHVAAGTLGRVTSRNRNCGRLAGEKPLFRKAPDGLASIGLLQHLDALEVAGTSMGDPRRVCTGMLAPSLGAPPKREPNDGRNEG